MKPEYEPKDYTGLMTCHLSYLTHSLKRDLSEKRGGNFSEKALDSVIFRQAGSPIYLLRKNFFPLLAIKKLKVPTNYTDTLKQNNLVFPKDFSMFSVITITIKKEIPQLRKLNL